MSEVIVDTLKHTGNSGTANLTLASNGNVTVANDLTVTDTLTVPTKKLVCPGTIIQVQNTTYTAQASVSLSSASTWYNISQINVAITPTAASSKFLINVLTTGETNYAPHDFSFKLVRTVGGSGTDIAIGDADGNNTRCTGVLPPGYHGDDNDTTGGMFTIPNYLDSDNSESRDD